MKQKKEYRREDKRSPKGEKGDKHTQNVLKETMFNLQMGQNLKYKRILWITLIQLNFKTQMKWTISKRNQTPRFTQKRST